MSVNEQSHWVKKIITSCILSIGLSALVLIGCEKDYKVFDTTPNFVVGKPKIRFVNLHFLEKEVILTIGADKLVKNLNYRELSAYEEAPDYLADRTPYTVTDPSGAVLLQDTLSVTKGSNYTLFILPSYATVITDYQIPSSLLIRLMISTENKRAKAALIVDPLSSSLADRASVRQVTFDPSMILEREGLPTFEDEKKNIFTAVVVEGASPPDFSFSSSYKNYGYFSATPGEYGIFWGSKKSGQSTFATEVINSADNGKALNLEATTPITFEKGKSYTVITNGTVGISNDVVYALSTRGPLSLKPIPYEAFVLDDSDGTARTLVPIPFARSSTQVAVLSFFDLNYEWKAVNPASLLGLAIKGLPIPNYGSQFESSETGDQTIELLPIGLSRPVISSATTNLQPNGKYFVFHYLDKDKTAKTKIIQPDTVVKYGATLKVNFGNFSPDLGPAGVLNLTTNELVIPELKFSEVSQSIELPLDRSFTVAPEIGIIAIEKAPKLAIVRPGSKEILVEIDLTPISSLTGLPGLLFSGAKLTPGAVAGQDNLGIVYTVVLSGNYTSTSDLDKFRKNIFAFSRSDKPTNSRENVFDWKLDYDVLK